MVKLRRYQQEAVDAVLNTWQNGKGSTRNLIQLPTGCGKTIVFGALAKRVNERTLILAHRDELIRQAVEKVQMVWPSVDIGVVKAEENEAEAQVVVGSVQTLMQPGRVDQLLDKGYFKLIVADEAHHYAAPSYAKVLEQLGVFSTEDTPLLVGVTATPARSDDRSLQRIFSRLVYQKSILEMIRAGYLSDLRGLRINTKLDFSRVKMVRSADGQVDFDERSLSKIVDQPWFNDLVVRVYLNETRNRQTIVFATSIEHSEALCRRFQERGVAADVVHGRLSVKERRARLEAFARREVNVMVNCNLLTEGFDQPDVSCIILARPTQSQVLYTQMVGRGTRLYPGKQDCLVIDFVGSTDVGFTLAQMFNMEPKDIKRKGSVAEAAAIVERQRREKWGEPAPREEWGGFPVPDWSSHRMDLFSRTQFRWLEVAPGALVLSGGEVGNLYLLATPESRWEVYVVKNRKATRLADKAPDVAWAQGVAEDYIRDNNKVSLATGQASWRSQPANDRQKALLKRLGIPYSPLITSGEASDKATLWFAAKDIRHIRAQRAQRAN